MLNTFAVVADPEEVAPELRRRYGEIADRISFYGGYEQDPDDWRTIVDAVRSL